MLTPAFDELLRQPDERRAAVSLTPAAQREVKRGHPWVWDRSITRHTNPGKPGDLAVIFDERRKFVAIGFQDPGAPIAIRILHAGAPRTIDRDFWAERIIAALALRQPLEDRPDTTAWRLINGENDGLPGIVVDRYHDVLVLRLDTLAVLPHLRPILEVLIELIEPTSIVLRLPRRLRGRGPAALHDGSTIAGTEVAAPVAFLENGLRFNADVLDGQKTGHFLDQRENRALVQTRCDQATVLDVFCHSGGFTVHALAGGARSVMSIDQSPYAIDAATTHVAINREVLGFGGTHRAETAEAFDAMDRLIQESRRFDVVIIDPPSFAPNAASLAAARRSYERLTRLGLRLLGDGGTLVQASCSSRIEDFEFHDLVGNVVDQAGFSVESMIRTGHALDHPIGFPEGSYLKATFLDLTRR